MGRQNYRKTADILRKTIEQLEADPTVDTQANAFVDLKCTLLSRILEIEASKARAESVIHLVDGPASEDAPKENRAETDSDTAIA